MNPVNRGNMQAGKAGWSNKNDIQSRVEYRPKQSNEQGKKNDVEIGNKQKDKEQVQNSKRFLKETNTPSTSNQFAILGTYEECIGDDLSDDQRRKVECFVTEKLQPTPSEQSTWNHKMVDYFNARWKLIIECNNEEEDVLEDNSNEGKCMADNELEGVDGCLQPTM